MGRRPASRVPACEPTSFSRLRLPLVGGLELGDELREKPRMVLVVGHGVMVDQVTAATAEDLAHGGRRQVGDGRTRAVFAEEREGFVRRKEPARVERVDVEGKVLGVAADEEVPGQADRLERET